MLNRIEATILAAAGAPGVALLALLFLGLHRESLPEPGPGPIVVRPVPVYSGPAPAHTTRDVPA